MGVRVASSNFATTSMPFSSSIPPVGNWIGAPSWVPIARIDTRIFSSFNIARLCFDSVSDIPSVIRIISP